MEWTVTLWMIVQHTTTFRLTFVAMMTGARA